MQKWIKVKQKQVMAHRRKGLYSKKQEWWDGERLSNIVGVSSGLDR